MPSELIECGRYPRRRLTVRSPAPKAGATAPVQAGTDARRRTLNAAAFMALLPALTVVAGGAAYLILAPRSPDLAAQLLRARLFASEGFATWSNWWYGGHTLPGYSVLFPALGWLLTPQLAGTLAAVAATACWQRLATGHFGPGAWLSSTWFAAGTVSELASGRLAFMAGMALALAAALALGRRRTAPAVAAAGLAALMSPVAGVFAALAGLALAAGRPPRALAGLATATGALIPVLVLAVLFPTPGYEPFALSALWPVPLLAGALLALTPAHDRPLRVGLVLYTAGCIAAYALPTPLGGNAVRLAWLLAGPLAGLLVCVPGQPARLTRAARRQRAPARPPRQLLLLALAVPLLYLQWQGAVRDTLQAATDPSTTAAYYRPLLAFLARQPGPPFRIEIPFTREHWESYEVAPVRPLARGWERQLDIGENPLFYGGRLTPARYEAWLHRMAVRFVALPDVPLDSSSVAEAALIRGGLRYLRLEAVSGHWRIYAVRHATPILSGPGTLVAIGPDTITLRVRRAGGITIRVRFAPVWSGAGLSDAGGFLRLRARRRGLLTLRAGF